MPVPYQYGCRPNTRLFAAYQKVLLNMPKVLLILYVREALGLLAICAVKKSLVKSVSIVCKSSLIYLLLGTRKKTMAQLLFVHVGFAFCGCVLSIYLNVGGESN